MSGEKNKMIDQNSTTKLNSIYSQNWVNNSRYDGKTWRYNLSPQDFSAFKRAYKSDGTEYKLWYTILTRWQEVNKRKRNSAFLRDSKEFDIVKYINDEIVLFNDWKASRDNLCTVIDSAKWVDGSDGTGYFEIVCDTDILDYVDSAIESGESFKRLHRYNDETIHGNPHSDAIYNGSGCGESNEQKFSTIKKTTNVPIVAIDNSSHSSGGGMIDSVIGGAVGGAAFEVVSDMLSD